MTALQAHKWADPADLCFGAAGTGGTTDTTTRTKGSAVTGTTGAVTTSSAVTGTTGAATSPLAHLPLVQPALGEATTDKAGVAHLHQALPLLVAG
jgi:hypothetical protein